MRNRVHRPHPKRRPGRYFAHAALVILAGTMPALLIASSARADTATPADGLTIGALAIAFTLMLLLLSLLARRITRNLTDAATRRSRLRTERAL